MRHQTSSERLSGPNAWQDAKRKSRHSNRRWVCWTDGTGEKFADLANAQGMKAAILAVGAHGKLFLADAGTFETYVGLRSFIRLFVAASKGHLIYR